MNPVSPAKYWVYENWQAGPHKATLHRAECYHCNNGNGQSGQGTASEHGEWRPFATLAAAKQPFSGKGGVQVIPKNCKHCSPETAPE